MSASRRQRGVCDSFAGIAAGIASAVPGFEQLDAIAGWIIREDLISPDAMHDFVPEVDVPLPQRRGKEEGIRGRAAFLQWRYTASRTGSSLAACCDRRAAECSRHSS